MEVVYLEHNQRRVEKQDWEHKKLSAGSVKTRLPFLKYWGPVLLRASLKDFEEYASEL